MSNNLAEAGGELPNTPEAGALVPSPPTWTGVNARTVLAEAGTYPRGNLGQPLHAARQAARKDGHSECAESDNLGSVLGRLGRSKWKGRKTMNRASAFVVGVVVAGVAAKLLAGNPSSPVAIQYLDARGEDWQLMPLGPRPEWKATFYSRTYGQWGNNSTPQVLFAGSRLVHKVVLDSDPSGNFGEIYLYDSSDPSDTSTPITSFRYLGDRGANPSQVELNVRVTKGLTVAGWGRATVLHGE
jgi:hypothetical protein